MKSVPIDKECPIPTKLYVTEAAKSAKKTEQERVVVDPDDKAFAKLLEEAHNKENKVSSVSGGCCFPANTKEGSV